MYNTQIKHLGKWRTEVIQIRGQVSYSQNVCFHKKNLSEYSHSNCQSSVSVWIELVSSNRGSVPSPQQYTGQENNIPTAGPGK